MAIGRGGKLDKYDGSSYLSDESDFYGDGEVKQDLEEKAADFNPSEWWQKKLVSPTELAESNRKVATKKKAATLYNPYEGQFYARQLSETVEEFLQRLPPQTTPVSQLLQWIFIANPFHRAPKVDVGNESIKSHEEAPPGEDSDLAKFVVLGGNILEELTSMKNHIAKKRADKAVAPITKAVNVQKEMIVQKLLKTATDLHVTSGKWMMFVDSVEINAVWSVVARATANNELGIAAKVAPDERDTRQDRLICVYTKDFNDMEDVGRVIRKMRDLGLVEMRKAIYYKCDAYTYLGLNSQNEYDIKASLYRSTDLLKPKKERDQKLEGFFYEKKNTED